MYNTLRDTLDAAKRANKAGRYEEAQALLDRARAIKAGPAAVAALDYAGDMVKAMRTERQEDARLHRAMQTAFKAEALAEIDPDAEQLANELHGGNYADAVYQKQQQYMRYLRGADIRQLSAAKTCVLSPRQLLEAVLMGLSAAELKATMQEAQDTLGGFLTAETLSDSIMGRAASLCVVRSRATVDTPGAGASLTYARWEGSGDIYSTALRGVWSSELQASVAENPRLVKSTIEPKLWRLKVIVSRSLLEDAGPRFGANLHAKFAETYAVSEDAEMLTGAGVTGPHGILAQQVPGTLANKDIRVTNSGNASAITADGVISTIYSLPGQYRRAPGFCVTMNAATVKAVRTLKDTGGRYLFDEGNYSICGYPLAESESMPDIAANAYPVLAGDFAGYAVGEKLGLSVELIQDSTLAETDSAAFYIRRRVGGAVAEGYRFSALKIAS